MNKLKTLQVYADARPAPGPIDDNVLSVWNAGLRAATSTEDANIIAILDPIGEDIFGDGFTAKRMRAALRSAGGDDVTVQINSPGGDYFEGLAIFNMLEGYEGSVRVEVIGIAASAASVIAMAGDTVVMEKGARLMIHNSAAMAQGGSSDFKEVAAFLAAIDFDMATVYEKKSGKTKTEIASLMDAETFFDGDAAVEAGLADEMVSIATVEDTTARSRYPAARAIEHALTGKLEKELTRTEARALMSELRRRTLDAATNDPATLDAGTVAAIQAAIETLKKGAQ